MELKPEDRIPERVLVICAHPDDIEFGVAGSVAKWRQQGAEVIYCLVTDGAAGDNNPDADLKKLKQVRREEQRAAAGVVGVTDIRFLDYPDGVLEPTLAVRRDLTRVIREVKPDRVVCQDPTTVFSRGEYVNHPDHRAAGEAAIYATFPSSPSRPIFPELLDEGFEPHQVIDLYMTLTTAPDTIVDISDTLEDKLEALVQHRSQLGDGKDAAERVRGWASDAGQQHGIAYGEVFRVLRFRHKESPNGKK